MKATVSLNQGYLVNLYLLAHHCLLQAEAQGLTEEQLSEARNRISNITSHEEIIDILDDYVECDGGHCLTDMKDYI